MKAKDTLLLNNTITQNPILVRRAWFWHVTSQITKIKINHFKMVFVNVRIKVMLKFSLLACFSL